MPRPIGSTMRMQIVRCAAQDCLPQQSAAAAGAQASPYTRLVARAGVTRYFRLLPLLSPKQLEQAFHPAGSNKQGGGHRSFPTG
jgi:hypothetical protein